MPQVVDPGDHDPADIVADRKEPGRERLGEFGLHLARILVDPALVDVDVLELEGCDRPVAGAGKDREGDEGSIAARSISVPAGIIWMTCRICSRVGTRASRWAFAILVSLADRLKYSASEYEIRDLYPGCPGSQEKKRFRALSVA